MPSYAAPVEDVLFLLRDVLPWERCSNLAGFDEATPDVVEAILGEAAKLCENVLQPLNLPGDQEGCARAVDGSVRAPKGFRAAYAAYAAGGWLGLAADPAFGGQGLPYTLAAAVNEFAAAANMALTMYPGLTQSAIAAISEHGSPAQKALYLPKLIAGEWTGTMNLTEPHCGTDLGLLKTRATPRADGSYAITGQKIFISAGEHDLADNIVHLVLARIEGAPPGVRGISLFIAPKIIPDADGGLGARNAIRCGSLERKMGIHANATCVMNYDGATTGRSPVGSPQRLRRAFRPGPVAPWARSGCRRSRRHRPCCPWAPSCASRRGVSPACAAWPRSPRPSPASG